MYIFWQILLLAFWWISKCKTCRSIKQKFASWLISYFHLFSFCPFGGKFYLIHTQWIVAKSGPNRIPGEINGCFLASEDDDYLYDEYVREHSLISNLRCHQLLEKSTGIVCVFDARIEKPSHLAMILDDRENVIDRIWISGKTPVRLHGLHLPFHQKLTVQIGGERTSLTLRGTILANSITFILFVSRSLKI